MASTTIVRTIWTFIMTLTNGAKCFNETTTHTFVFFGVKNANLCPLTRYINGKIYLPKNG